MKPGGRLIISTPNPFSAFYGALYLKSGDGAFNPEHTTWFCQQVLRQLLERCGFRVETVCHVDGAHVEKARFRSVFHRVFGRVWKVLRPVVPARYRSTIVVVAISRSSSNQ